MEHLLDELKSTSEQVIQSIDLKKLVVDALGNFITEVYKLGITSFDVAWSNFWRANVGPSNWNAALIFLKYSLKNSIIWKYGTTQLGRGQAYLISLFYGAEVFPLSIDALILRPFLHVDGIREFLTRKKIISIEVFSSGMTFSFFH